MESYDSRQASRVFTRDVWPPFIVAGLKVFPGFGLTQTRWCMLPKNCLKTLLESKRGGGQSMFDDGSCGS